MNLLALPPEVLYGIILPSVLDERDGGKQLWSLRLVCTAFKAGIDDLVLTREECCKKFFQTAVDPSDGLDLLKRSPAPPLVYKSLVRDWRSCRSSRLNDLACWKPVLMSERSQVRTSRTLTGNTKY